MYEKDVIQFYLFIALGQILFVTTVLGLLLQNLLLQKCCEHHNHKFYILYISHLNILYIFLFYKRLL